MELNDEFQKWIAEQGMTFCCSATQYADRVAAFVRERGWNQGDFDALMDFGLGPEWRDQ